MTTCARSSRAFAGRCTRVGCCGCCFLVQSSPVQSSPSIHLSISLPLSSSLVFLFPSLRQAASSRSPARTIPGVPFFCALCSPSRNIFATWLPSRRSPCSPPCPSVRWCVFISAVFVCTRVRARPLVGWCFSFIFVRVRVLLRDSKKKDEGE